jgi:type II restriction enzyme
VDLALRPELVDGYKSLSQQARILTEDWAERSMFCPNCSSSTLERHVASRAVTDFACTSCEQEYQLKGTTKKIGRTVTNSDYQKKIEAIRNGTAPNYVFVTYDRTAWQITSGFIVPGHFLTENAVKARKALLPPHPRAGWIGSTILLHLLPPDGRIKFVHASQALPLDVVRTEWAKFKFLKEKPADSRGWIADVLSLIRALPSPRFHLRDLYTSEARLSKLHPKNNNIQPKIRQQVEVLRDQKVLRSLGAGVYELVVPEPQAQHST